MASVLFVTPTSGHAPWSKFVMNVTSELSQVAALFAVGKEFQTHTTAKSARKLRKTEMVAQKLLT